jgi:hypothetical protein
MTEIAILLGWQVIRRFEKACNEETAGVAAFATAGNAWMNRSQEFRIGSESVSKIVAHTAVILCRNVVRNLTGRVSAVMTTYTVPGNGWMDISEKHRIHKSAGIRVIMTHAAIILRGNVVKRFTHRDYPIVTG